MRKLSRRDFLKVSGAIAAGALLPNNLFSLKTQGKDRPNIIIILMDALSARHLSLYGYPRLTSPNIDAFAENSTVFHNHYSGGNFTTAGTASMLTGMLPWKHRAINGGGVISSKFVGINPYTLLGADYYRFAFSQNAWSDRLIGQFYRDVDRFLPPFSYTYLKDDKALMWAAKNDRTVASMAFDNFLFAIDGVNDLPGSLMLGYLNKSRVYDIGNEMTTSKSYAKGLPEAMNGVYYRNEEIYHGVYSEISRLQQQEFPYFAYFHLYSPHAPYRPRNDYRNLFRDAYVPVEKPVHPFDPPLNYLNKSDMEDMQNNQRVYYDRQIAQVDDEFGKLMFRLKNDGVLDNSYLIFTSDHGELFERGFVGHGYQFMYESVLRIPLIIHTPRQINREDIFSKTSNIDVLPTILSIAGKQIPSDIDGKILPGFGGQADENRPIFSIVALDNNAFSPIKKAVISMQRRSYKLIAYLGYEGFDQVFELYNLESDLDEIDNLVTKDTQIFSSMKDDLYTYLGEANRQFARK